VPMPKWLRLIKSTLSVVITAVLLLATSYSPTSQAKQQIINLHGANTVLLNVEINAATTDTFIAAIIGKRLSLPQDQILYVIIASPGGQYPYGLILQEVFKQVPNIALICKYCASAAGFIFGTADVPRYVTEKSLLIMHEMYLPHLTAKESLRTDILKDLVKSSEDFNRAIYTVIGMSKEDYDKKIVNTEWDVEGEDIVKIHMADKLVTLNCDPYVKSIAPDTCKPK
jgi:ATP-dependent protease ClpP protease subunit